MKPIKTKPFEPPQGEPKPGHPPMNRILVVDHKGNIRGHVGKTATAATAARFVGHHGASLGKHEGRDAWITDPPPKKPPPMMMGPDGQPVPMGGDEGGSGFPPGKDSGGFPPKDKGKPPEKPKGPPPK